MRNLEKLSAEARAYFHERTGYCATPKARARAAWLARQEEKNAAEAARQKPFASKRPQQNGQAK